MDWNLCGLSDIGEREVYDLQRADAVSARLKLWRRWLRDDR